MKCQILFSRKNNKGISKCHLKFLPSMQSVNLFITYFFFCLIPEKEETPEYATGVRQSSNAKITFNDKDYFQKVTFNHSSDIYSCSKQYFEILLFFFFFFEKIRLDISCKLSVYCAFNIFSENLVLLGTLCSCRFANFCHDLVQTHLS